VPRYDVYHWLNLFSMSFLITMFVVLVFLMVVTPIYTGEPMIPTPFASSGYTAAGFERDLNIGLTARGTILFRERRISRAELLRVFRTKALSGRAPRIYAETGTPYRYIRGVVAAAREAGVTQVTFMCRRARDEFADTIWE